MIMQSHKEETYQLNKTDVETKDIQMNKNYHEHKAYPFHRHDGPILQPGYVSDTKHIPAIEDHQ